MGRGTRWKGTACDHKGPPSRSPPPSPLRNDEHVSNKPTRVRARGAGKDPATLFPRQLERVPVTLSAAKGLGSWAARSFAALRMTARAPLKSAHGKPYLRMSTFTTRSNERMWLLLLKRARLEKFGAHPVWYDEQASRSQVELQWRTKRSLPGGVLR